MLGAKGILTPMTPTNCYAANSSRNSTNIRNSLIYCVNRYFLMFGGSQGHSPAYERAHAGSDLLTLVSYNTVWSKFTQVKIRNENDYKFLREKEK